MIFNWSVSKSDLSTLLTEHEAYGQQTSLMPEARGDSHWPQPSGVPHTRGWTSPAERRVQSWGQVWALVSEEEEGVGHPPTHLPMFYYLFALCFKGGCKLETGAWTAVLTGRQRQRGSSFLAFAWVGAGRCHGSVTGPSWRPGSKMSEPIPPFVPRAFLTHPGMSVLLWSFAPRVLGRWGNMQPSTREPGEGETKEQRVSLVSKPQLPFDLWSLNITSAKVRERQEVKTIAGKLEIHPSAFTPSSAEAFENVN